MKLDKFKVQKTPTVKAVRASVKNGKLVKVSISQIESFKSCPRAWAFDKAPHIKVPRPPPTQAQLTGIKGHEENEELFLKGNDRRGQTALAGDEFIQPLLKYAPFKGGLGQVEFPLPSDARLGELEIEGYIDFLIPESDMFGERVPVIYDWKFKSQMKYALGRESLIEDPQGNIYAKYIMDLLGCDKVVFAHVTFQTKGHADAKLTWAYIERVGAEKIVSELSRVANEEMTQYVNVATQDEVPYNIQSCSKYGGCAYAAVCNQSPQNRYRRMGKMRVKEAIQGKSYKFADGSHGVYDRNMKGLYKFRGASGYFSKSAEDETEEMGMLESTMAKPVVPAVREPIVEEEISLVREDLKAETLAPPPQAPPTEVDKAVAAGEVPEVKEDIAVVEEAKPKKKWGKKVKAEEPKVNVEANIEAPKVNLEVKNPEIAVETDDLVLLVDVTLLGVGTDLTQYVADLASKVAAMFQVPDVRLGEGNGPLGFGKWKAALALAAKENPPKGLCFIQRSELSDPIIEALRPIAKGKNV